MSALFQTGNNCGVSFVRNNLHGRYEGCQSHIMWTEHSICLHSKALDYQILNEYCGKHEN